MFGIFCQKIMNKENIILVQYKKGGLFSDAAC